MLGQESDELEPEPAVSQGFSAQLPAPPPYWGRAVPHGTGAIAVRVGPKPAPSLTTGRSPQLQPPRSSGNCASEQVGLGRALSMGQGLHGGSCEKPASVLSNFSLLSLSCIGRKQECAGDS